MQQLALARQADALKSSRELEAATLEDMKARKAAEDELDKERLIRKDAEHQLRLLQLQVSSASVLVLAPVLVLTPTIVARHPFAAAAAAAAAATMSRNVLAECVGRDRYIRSRRLSLRVACGRVIVACDYWATAQLAQEKARTQALEAEAAAAAERHAQLEARAQRAEVDASEARASNAALAAKVAGLEEAQRRSEDDVHGAAAQHGQALSALKRQHMVELEAAQTEARTLKAEVQVTVEEETAAAAAVAAAAAGRLWSMTAVPAP